MKKPILSITSPWEKLHNLFVIGLPQNNIDYASNNNSVVEKLKEDILLQCTKDDKLYQTKFI